MRAWMHGGMGAGCMTFFYGFSSNQILLVASAFCSISFVQRWLNFLHSEFEMAPKGGIRKRLLDDGQHPSGSEATGSGEPLPSSSRSLRRRVGDAPEPLQEQPLLQSLKRDWGKGLLSSKQVQEYAAGADRQGAKGLAAVAAAGGSGRHPQNLQRSLMAMFGSPMGAPDFTWCEIETKRGKKVHPFLLPHAWFASMHAQCPDQFASAVRGPEGACAAFWAMMADTSFVREHPVLDRSMMACTIPVGLYGDAGAFSQQDSLMVFTWNSLLGAGATMEKKYLMTCIKKTEIIPATYSSIFAILSWSFNVMLTGVWPEVDWMGRQLAPKPEFLAQRFRACLCQVRGDWEFYCSIFSFPKWNMATRMCWMCDASASGLLAFSNCGPDAPWRATRHSHETYIARLHAQGEPVPVLFEKVLGLRLESVMIDVLHTCDLGFAAHVAGNIFHECVQQKAFDAGDMDANVKGQNDALLAWYKKNKIESRIKGKITKDRIKTSSSWPKLKAKGAATRHVIPFCLELARAHCDVRRVALCQVLCSFYELLNSQGMFLDAEAKARMPALARRMCGLFAQLSSEALQANRKTWKMTPKVHLLLHLCEWQAPDQGNPRFCWTYSDEDLVGTMVEVAQSCHASTMAATAMVKWLVFAFEQSPEL